MNLRARTLYSPDSTRPPLRLPDGARLAVWVVVNVEHYEYLPTMFGQRDPWPRTPHPDVAQYSYRDYGNRAGFWRILQNLRSYDLPFTAALNSGVLAYYPELADALRASDCAVMGHGRYNTEYVNDLSEDEERRWLAGIRDDVRALTGKEVRGTLGPGISATLRTPDLLAELGMSYQADWVLDDQPTPIRVRTGRLVSMPYSFELNDARMIGDPGTAEDFVDSCLRQFRVLRREGERSGRVMCLAMHTFISGQPHVAPALRRLFEELRRHDDVWFTTADEIADWYLDRCYDEQLAYAEGLAGAGGDLP